MADNFDKMRTAQQENGDSDTNQQFLTFTVGDEEYGVDIMQVREIKGWTETTRLPGTHEFMRGVMNLRGLIVPIFDLRARFRMGLTEVTPKHVIVIMAIGERNIGLLVDTVSDILNVMSSHISAAPVDEFNADEQCVRGLISHDDRMIVLLSVEKLIDKELIKKLDLENTHAA